MYYNRVSGNRAAIATGLPTPAAQRIVANPLNGEALDEVKAAPDGRFCLVLK
jgi:hypothetical protein